MINYIKIVFLAISLQKVFCQDSSWSYRESDKWGDVSQICATGQRQSPINLEHNGAWISMDDKPTVEFLYHDELPEETTIYHNGAYVILSGIWERNVPSITGSIVFRDEIYNFNNFNIHWGIDNKNGTEHSIQGQKYALELHIAYLNNKYQSVREASNSPDGVAALCILFEVDDSVAPNPGMQDFAPLVGLAQNPGDSNPATSFNLTTLIPNSSLSWYSYYGSLSTPPCTENVQWLVLSEPQPINTQIMEAVRSINLPENNKPNLRPLQPIKNHVVKFYAS